MAPSLYALYETQNLRFRLQCLQNSPFMYAPEQQAILDGLKESVAWYAQILSFGEKDLTEMIVKEAENLLERSGVRVHREQLSSTTLLRRERFLQGGEEKSEEITQLGILVYRERLYGALYTHQSIGKSFVGGWGLEPGWEGHSKDYCALYHFSADDLASVLAMHSFSFAETLGYSAKLKSLPKKLFEPTLPKKPIGNVHSITDLVNHCWDHQGMWRLLEAKFHPYENLGPI